MQGKMHLKWCLKQRRGVRLVEPSKNLVKAYLEKSKRAVKSMEVNSREGIIEWAVSSIVTTLNILLFTRYSAR